MGQINACILSMILRKHLREFRCSKKELLFNISWSWKEQKSTYEI